MSKKKEKIQENLLADDSAVPFAEKNQSSKNQKENAEPRENLEPNMSVENFNATQPNASGESLEEKGVENVGENQHSSETQPDAGEETHNKNMQKDETLPKSETEPEKIDNMMAGEEYKKILAGSSVESPSNDTANGLGLSQEIAQEKIKVALEKQSPKKRRRSTIINLCLLLVNFVFLFFIVKNLVSDVGDLNFSDVIQNQGKKLWWLAGGLLVYALYIFVQTALYKVLIREFSGKNKWGLAYDVAVVGKYYDNVTPFAVGGQPFQIVRLNQSGLSAGVSTSIPVIKMLVNNAVNAIFCLCLFVFCLPQIPLSSPFNNILLLIFEILAVIGLVISVIVVLVMVLVSSGTLLTRSVISGILRLGYKLKIVKNYRKTYKKVLNQVAEYKLSMSYLKTHKKLFFKMVVLCLLECISYASLPYFVIMAFSTNIDVDTWLMFLLVCITKYYICFMASSFIPLPGGTGLIEIAFICLFATNVGDNIVWALLFWRFLSYYLVILHGFVNEMCVIGKNFAKNRKLAKTQKMQQ